MRWNGESGQDDGCITYYGIMRYLVSIGFNSRSWVSLPSWVRGQLAVVDGARPAAGLLLDVWVLWVGVWVLWADVVVFVGDADIVGGCWR
jgi:hypothetical protein